MSASNVIELASPTAVDQAWNEYVVLALQLRQDHSLLSDRDFNQRMAKAHEKWRRLFLIQDQRR